MTDIEEASNDSVPGGETPNTQAPASVEPQVLERVVEETVTRVVLAGFSGPLPPPSILAEYDKIVPGSAKLVVEEFQKNGAHSRGMEQAGLDAAIATDQRAQWIAGSLILVCFVFAWWAADHGHERLAIGTIVVLAVSIISGFLTGAMKKRPRQGKLEDD